MFKDGRIAPKEFRDEFEDILKELATFFDERWLSTTQDHPLQKLWARRDILSSIELITLGQSIRKIKKCSTDNIASKIKLIKSKDLNSRRGSIYEIIIAGALCNPPQQIARLLPVKNEVFDIKLKLQNRFDINISIKNSGKSKNALNVEEELKKLEEIIKNNLRDSRHIIILKEGIYPEQEDWDKLREELPAILERADHYSDGGWTIWFAPIDSGENTLYDKVISYSITAAIPFHRNEEERLRDTLDEACSDINREGERETDTLKNIVFMHFPKEVSLDQYLIWSNNYLKEHPKSPISGIYLFQPAVVTDRDKGINFLNLPQIRRFRSEFIEILKEQSLNFSFNFPIGVVNDYPSRQILTVGEREIQITEHYTYNLGNYYFRVKGKIGESVEFTAQSGIQIHFIDEKGHEIPSDYPFNHDLLII